MLKNYKKTLIVTSLVTLLPMLVGLLLWDRLPGQLAVHFGLDGKADGFGSLGFAVFGLPLIMLATQWLCVVLSDKLAGGREQGPKAMKLVLWIVPVLANVVCGCIFAIALGRLTDPLWFLQLMLGGMFLVIGNYMPKYRQNYTMGIRVRWTLDDEENWNATHRFGGRVWAVGGAVILLGALLPEGWGLCVLFIAMAVLVAAPILYSYLFYLRQKKAGGELTTNTPGMKLHGKPVMIFSAVVLAGAAVLLCTGDLSFRFDDEALTVEASYFDDLTVPYAKIDEAEYRQGRAEGVRTFGFGSPRLQMGAYRSEELGAYTRYTYTGSPAYVILRSGEKTLVLGGKDEASTRALYEGIVEHIGK